MEISRGSRTSLQGVARSCGRALRIASVPVPGNGERGVRSEVGAEALQDLEEVVNEVAPGDDTRYSMLISIDKAFEEAVKSTSKYTDAYTSVGVLLETYVTTVKTVEQLRDEYFPKLETSFLYRTVLTDALNPLREATVKNVNKGDIPVDLHLDDPPKLKGGDFATRDDVDQHIWFFMAMHAAPSLRPLRQVLRFFNDQVSRFLASYYSSNPLEARDGLARAANIVRVFDTSKISRFATYIEYWRLLLKKASEFQAKVYPSCDYWTKSRNMLALPRLVISH